MRLTEKRKGKNVIPLRYVVYGKDIPFWGIEYRNQTEKFLYGDAADKLATYEDAGLEPEEIKLNMDGLDEYRKAEAEGRLVILPCKVGDKVYALERFCDGNRGDCDSWLKCEECKDYQQEVIERRIGTLFQAVSVIEMLGKTVFLTREEAEAALKGET